MSLLNKTTPKRTYNFFLLKLDLYNIAFIILLAVSLGIRIYLLDFPGDYSGMEGSKSYIAAHNIVQHYEISLTGLRNHILHQYLSSPVYYYFLSLFLFIKDSVLFLSFVFVLFQLATITLIYKIAKRISPGTAIIAASIFSFSAYILERSGNIWGNYAMQPFLNLGFLLLLLAYTRKSYKLLLVSALVAVFSVALHNSAIGVFPLFLVLAFLILKQQGKSVVHYLGILLASFISMLVFYAPTIAYIVKNNLLKEMLPILSGQGARGTIFVQSIPDFFQNIYIETSALLEIFSFTTTGPYFSLNYLLIAIIAFSTILYFLKKNSPHKKYIFILLLFIVQQLIFVSLLEDAFPFVKLYLIPILGIFAIFIAAIINSVFSGHIILNIGKVVLVVLLLSVVSGNFYMFYSKPVPFENIRNIYSARDALIEEVLRIQKEEGFEDINFFQIRSFNNKLREVRNDILWALMEKKLDRKLTTVTGGGVGYEENNFSDYIFLSCYYQRGAHNVNQCKEHFLKLNPGYEITKEIFRGNILTIYESKKLSALNNY